MTFSCLIGQQDAGSPIVGQIQRREKREAVREQVR